MNKKNLNLQFNIVTGPIGIIDASLVRFLENIKERAGQLLVHVTESIYNRIIPKSHLYEFIKELSPVDSIITDNSQLERTSGQTGVTLSHLPEQELTRYTEARIFKKIDIGSNNSDHHLPENKKSATAEELIKIYGANPKERRQKVGLVSGSFDLIHLGHVRYINAAKKQCDVVVVATMSTSSIQQQEKNSQGDRPIYSLEDRLEVLSALKSTDHIVVFPEPDCKEVIRILKPDCFFKNAKDMPREVVKEECRLVESLGGKVIVTTDDLGYSSTEMIDYIIKISKEEE